MEEQEETVKSIEIIIKKAGNDYDIELKHSQDLEFIELMEVVFTLLAYAKKNYDYSYAEYKETMHVMGTLLYENDEDAIKIVKKTSS